MELYELWGTNVSGDLLRECPEEMVWAFEEEVWRQCGPSISVVGCSGKDLVERVQGGTHLVSRLRG